ncbi:TIGR00266 family protein [Piscirickettsia litoralis]|uniref:TIGR00266 family protein n=1 Tax=Piscirickettsia litoralis TaxID=1891921 RepID=A0ABX3A267_9GAMM|nr:TIGR00266 family protein [Piscirickettsia litoralis]ODN42322.1 TIGR00266 family protein [Piscirickettsia litoralis]
MADEIDYKLIGHDLQIVEIELDPGEAVQAEAGAMVYMRQGIEMQTSTGGGIFSGFKRMLSGAGFFITHFSNNANSGKSHVAFSAPYPGSIVPIDLTQHSGEILAQKDAFLCCAQGINIDIAFTKRLSAGFFGGEGFILQRLSGDGMAFIHAGGAVHCIELDSGESLRVDSGCLAAFEKTVSYDIRFVGGFKNALFGKEGLFMAELVGPGKVYVQSLPFARLAERMATAIGTNKGQGDA